MPDKLREISGIAFLNGKSDTVYAEEDENGRVYHFKPGDKNWPSTRFGKNGDFEDISICNNYVIMLRSDGCLFSFPVSETKKAEANQVKEFKHLIPDGEYEGLAAEEPDGKIYVLCKHCDDDKTRTWGGGSILQMDASGNLIAVGKFEIDIKAIDAADNTQGINFHPSALARNLFTREWFVLSSVNKLLVITDENWKVKSVFPLDPSLFEQPEGMPLTKNKISLFQTSAVRRMLQIFFYFLIIRIKPLSYPIAKHDWNFCFLKIRLYILQAQLNDEIFTYFIYRGTGFSICTGTGLREAKDYFYWRRR